MKYIDYINRFWYVCKTITFTGIEIAVFFYILNEFNKSWWGRGVRLSSADIVGFFGIHRHTLRSILDKIDNFTDVKVERVNGSKWINFTLKPAIQNIQVEKAVQQPAIQNIQVEKPVQKAVQQPAIENVQVPSREYNINYINKKIINKDKDIKDKEKINKKENLKIEKQIENDPIGLQKTMLDIYEKLTLTN